MLDERIRALKTASEGKTAQKNKLSKENGKLFGQKKAAEKRGEDTSAIDAAIATKNTPATTIVAAWINAETGVGPSIASGSQMCNGNIADLPAPPMKIRTNAHDAAEQPINVTPAELVRIPVGFDISDLKSNVSQ